MRASHGLIGLLLIALCGCANSAYRQVRADLSGAPNVPELTQVPFFAQDDYQCGPAALAMVMQAAHLAIEPEQLSAQLYIEERRGSLQVEMLAATRRQGLLPYVHQDGLPSLFAQLQAGYPVVVLQNLGVSWAPSWHYAVVVGYEPERERLILRSGQQPRLHLSLRSFMRTWAYSDFWMMTVHQPTDIPVGAEVVAYLSQASGLQRAGQESAALAAYGAAIERWPDNWLAMMALANGLYAQQQYQAAEPLFRRAQALSPHHPAPLHNLAWTLIRQGRRQAALPYASAAAGLSDAPEYQSALLELQNRAAEAPDQL